jgi:hypothetical protein
MNKDFREISKGELCEHTATALSLPYPLNKTIPTPERGGKKGRSYKPLPKEFRSDGFTYRQIVREGSAVLYEQSWSGRSNPSVCYEVIRIQRRDGFRIREKFVEPYEAYPKSETWGVHGYTLTDKDAAFAKLQEVAGT